MKLPAINKPIPSLMAEEIIGVQPMTSSTSEIFTMKESGPVVNKFGDLVHNIIEGWRVYDGNDFVDFLSFIDRYGLKSISCSDSRRKILAQWYYNACTQRR